MKKIVLIAAMIITGLSFQARGQNYYDRGYDDQYNYGGYDNDGFGYFYTSLSPYGSWIEFGDGVYGWRPVHMRVGWAPYANGRWLWTSDGWYWDSYEPFGYIVYHYGRWYYDAYYGWVWIPDYQWAPAWVEWRYDDAYIGWAPLPPYAVFSISIGIRFTHTYYTPYSHWHFVKYHYFCDPYVGKYYIASKYKHRIYSRTKYRNDYGYRNGRVLNRGIDVDLIRKRGNVDIRERKIRTVSSLRDINERNRITNNEIRTFIPDRSNFSGAKVRNMKIDRTGRRTTLETSKLEFGRKNLQRKQTQELRKTEMNRIDRNTTREKVNQDIRKEQKRQVPDTRIKTNERKSTGNAGYQIQERKNTRTVKPNVDNRQKTQRKVNEGAIERKSNQQKKETKISTPSSQRRSEVTSGRSDNSRGGTVKSSGVKRQTDSRSGSKEKSQTNNARKRR